MNVVSSLATNGNREPVTNKHVYEQELVNNELSESYFKNNKKYENSNSKNSLESHDPFDHWCQDSASPHQGK